MDQVAIEPRFLADAMLERLARWLRVLGFDAASAAASDQALFTIASLEGRYLLTRDRRLADDARPVDALLIRSARPLNQLREVLDHFGLSPRRELFQRCLICNVPLEPATEQGAARRCPKCGRLYWEGLHTQRMRAALARAFPSD